MTRVSHKSIAMTLSAGKHTEGLLMALIEYEMLYPGVMNAKSFSYRSNVTSQWDDRQV